MFSFSCFIIIRVCIKQTADLHYTITHTFIILFYRQSENWTSLLTVHAAVKPDEEASKE